MMKSSITYRTLVLAIIAALSLGLAPEAQARLHGGSAVPSAPGSISFYNSGASTVSNTVITVGLAAASGDIPDLTSHHIVVYDGATALTTQQDRCSQWLTSGSPNGKGKFCSLSIPLSSLAAGATKNLTWQIASGAPNTTPNVSTSNITGNTNFVLKTAALIEAAGTQETGTWDLLNLNYVLANCQQYNSSTGYGSNPNCGWDITDTGPNQLGIHAFMYAQEENGSGGYNNLHKWIRTDAYFSFMGSGSTPCPCSVGFNISQPNSFGAISGGTVGSGPYEGGYYYQPVLYNSSTVIHAWGGTGDTRNIATLTSSNFNTSNSNISLPSGNWLDNTGGIFGVSFSSSGGSLPTGLTANQVYFIKFTGTDTIALYPYACDVDNAAAPCTSGQVTFSTSGSGTISMTPWVYTMPQTGAPLRDTSGQRIWISAAGTATTAPTILRGHDCNYLFQKSHAIAPYITPLCGNFLPYSSPTTGSTVAEDYYPNTYTYPVDMGTTGDGPGDERIGEMNHTAIYTLFSPNDPTAEKQDGTIASGFGAINMYYLDETVGLPLTLNNGSDKAGTKYATLGTAYPSNRLGPYSYITSPFQIVSGSEPDSNIFYWRYGQWLDPSHLPLPQQAQMLKTAEPEWEDQMVQEELMSIGGNYTTSCQPSTIVYYRAPDCQSSAAAANTNQTRGAAWQFRIMDMADYFQPYGSPISQYIRDLHADASNFNADFITNQASILGPLHYFWIDTSGYTNGYELWETDFVYLAFGVSAIRNEYTADKTFENWLSAQIIGRADNVGGTGCLWCGAARESYPFTGPNTSYSNIAQNWSDYWTWTAPLGASNSNQGWTASAEYFASFSGTTMTVVGSYSGTVASNQTIASPAYVHPGFRTVSGSGSTWTLNSSMTTLGGTATVTSSGNTLNVTAITGQIVCGSPYYGAEVFVSGVDQGVYVSACNGSGTGGTGTYTLSGNLTLSSPTSVSLGYFMWNGPYPFSYPGSGLITDGGSQGNSPVSLITDMVTSFAIGAALNETDASSLYSNARYLQYNSGCASCGPPPLTFTNYQWATGYYSSFGEFAIGPPGASNLAPANDNDFMDDHHWGKLLLRARP